MIGGSTSLTGAVGTDDEDKNRWKLMKGDEEITEGVTMSIVPVSSSTGQFPKWIYINNDKMIDPYHKVFWRNCTQGTYKFKVKAEYKTNTFESAEITLNIISTITPATFHQEI